MKSSYVLLEDIPCHYDAQNLKTLELCLQKRHVTSSCQNNERIHLEEIEGKQAIIWCRMITGLSLITQYTGNFTLRTP